MKRGKYLLFFILLIIAFSTKVNAASRSIKDGVYTIYSALSDNYTLDLKGGTVKNKSNIQLYKDNSSTAQRWKVTYLNNGYYKIVSMKNNNYSLDVKQASKKKGTNVQLYKYNGSNAQQWLIKETGDGYYYIISRCNNLALDIKGGKLANSQNIQVYTQNKSKAQKFVFNEIASGTKTISDGLYNIKSLLDINKGININNGNTNNNTNINLKSINNTVNDQKWFVKHLGNGVYRIAQYNDFNIGLDVDNGKRIVGTNIQLYKYTSSINQHFYIKAAGDGSYNIVSKRNGLALTLNNNSVTDLTNINLNVNNNMDSQKFIFTKVEETAGDDLDDGYYYITNSIGQNYLLDTNTNNISENLEVKYQSSKGIDSQKWYFSKDSNNYYTISTKMNDDYVLGYINNKIVLTKRNSGNNYKWMIKRVNNYNYYLVNENGMYLSLNSTIMNNNTLKLINPTGTNLELFRLHKATTKQAKKVLNNGYYTISSVLNSNTNIDLRDGKLNNGTNIQLYKAVGTTSNQKWYIQHISDNYYKISSIKNKNKVFDVSGIGVKNPSNVQLYDYNGQINQQWIIEMDENGYYSFVSNVGNYYLTVHNSSTANDTNIEVDNYKNNNSQKFILTEVKDVYFGMDVSVYNNNINWSKVKASNIDFAVIRAGYGCDFESQDDTKFLENTKGAAANKIPYGVYLFSYAENNKEIDSEVDHTIRMLNKLSSNTKSYMKLPVFFDIEVDKYANKYSKAYLTSLADRYCSAIIKKGYQCGVYANRNWLNNHIDGVFLEKKYMIWLAEWNKATTFSKALSYKPTYNGSYNIWQFTNNGRVNGISGAVDLNIGYNLF